MFANTRNPQDLYTAVKTILERAGITPTRQRLEIALVMLNRAQHLSADQVLALVNRDGKNVSKATVYNTLGLFSQKGVVREVHIDPNRVFFDSNTGEHYHLYNEDTGILIDIEPADLQLSGSPAVPAGTVLTGVDIIIRVRNG